MRTMRSAIIQQWHSIDVLQIPVPVLEENEVRIRIKYCGICGSDLHVYNGVHPTAKVPVPMGHEMMGFVEEINTKLPVDFKIGDRVTLHAASCGKCERCLSGAANQCLKTGVKHQTSAGYADYMTGNVADVVKIPDSLSDRVAALLEPFACAVRTTQRGKIKAGDSVLVIGGGTIGFATALMARKMGAGRIIMSVKHQNRIDLAKEYGFETIDPETEDVIARINELTAGNGVNVTFETSCAPSGIKITPAVTAVEGTIVMLAVGLEPRPEFDIGAIALKELNIIGSRAHTIVDMKRAAKMLEIIAKENNLEKMISDTISLDDVEAGFRMMIEHRNKGKILVNMDQIGK